MPSNPRTPAPEQIILGIDPGTTIMGYGIIRVRGKKVELVEMGALHLSKYRDHAVKLKRIFDRCAALIEAHAPDHLAVEAPFFGKNVHDSLGGKVPVGLISNNWGGTKVEQWMPAQTSVVAGCGHASSGELYNAMIAPYAIGPLALDGFIWCVY